MHGSNLGKRGISLASNFASGDEYQVRSASGSNPVHPSLLRLNPLGTH